MFSSSTGTVTPSSAAGTNPDPEGRLTSALVGFFQLCAEKEEWGQGKVVNGDPHSGDVVLKRKGRPILNFNHQGAATIMNRNLSGDGWGIYAWHDAEVRSGMSFDQLPELLSSYLSSELFSADPTRELYQWILRFTCTHNPPTGNDNHDPRRLKAVEEADDDYMFSALVEYATAHAYRRLPNYRGLEVTKRPEPTPAIVERINQWTVPSEADNLRATNQGLADENARLRQMLRAAGINPDTGATAGGDASSHGEDGETKSAAGP